MNAAVAIVGPCAGEHAARVRDVALAHGLAASTAGGTHHAFRDFGAGFCIFNDLAVTARTLRVIRERFEASPRWRPALERG